MCQNYVLKTMNMVFWWCRCKLIFGFGRKKYHEIKFNKNIGFMNTVIYIYRCVSVLSAIEEVTSFDNYFISREEIDEFIKMFNIDFKINDHFKLSDQSTWKF